MRGEREGVGSERGEGGSGDSSVRTGRGKRKRKENKSQGLLSKTALSLTDKETRQQQREGMF